MSSRHLPVRPNLDQLRNQAKDLLRAIRRGDPSALENSMSITLDRRHPIKSNSPMFNSHLPVVTRLPVGLVSLRRANLSTPSGKTTSMVSVN